MWNRSLRLSQPVGYSFSHWTQLNLLKWIFVNLNFFLFGRLLFLTFSLGYYRCFLCSSLCFNWLNFSRGWLKILFYDSSLRSWSFNCRQINSFLVSYRFSQRTGKNSLTIVWIWWFEWCLMSRGILFCRFRNLLNFLIWRFRTDWWQIKIWKFWSILFRFNYYCNLLTYGKTWVIFGEYLCQITFFCRFIVYCCLVSLYWEKCISNIKFLSLFNLPTQNLALSHCWTNCRHS